MRKRFSTFVVLGTLGLGFISSFSWARELTPSVCRIRSDQQVTRAEANDRVEGFYCWGFLHARERGVQMQVLRATARGRLAEEHGASFLKSDFLLRLLELERRAELIATQTQGADRQVLEAYASGVNAGGTPIFRSDPWRLSDTVLLVLLQSFDQTRRSFEQDIATDRHARESHPLNQDFPWQTPILKPGEYPASVDSDHAQENSKSSVYPFEPEDQATGSNSWVVAPKHSRSGYALLANDPHLQLKSPPFWHWVQLSWPGVQLVGASLPGIPLVASGASGHLAWGLTNSYVDVADAVLVPESGLKTRSLRPLVWVKKWGFKWPIFFKTFQILEGTDLPVLPIESPEPGQVLALRWTGFDLTASDLSPLWQFPEARTASELDELLGKVGVPSWNFIFADTNGNIGYRAVGRLPKRAPRSRGTLERLSQAELKSWPMLSSQEAPHLLNPSRGWVATANQLQWGPDGAVSLGWNHSESFRAFRIEELLRAGLKEKHSLESFQKIQCDQQAVDARFLLPVLLPHLPKSEVTERLESWNFDAGLDCQECAVFRLWMKALGDPQWTYARAVESHPEFWREAAQALEGAVEKLRGLPSAPWIRWGSFHRAPFPATEIPRPFPMSDLESALPTGGDDHSVWPGSSDWIDLNGVRGFSHHSSASQRIVVEMSNPPKIHWVLPGENRGDTHEKAVSPAREAWAGCQLQELSGWASAR